MISNHKKYTLHFTSDRFDDPVTYIYDEKDEKIVFWMCNYHKQFDKEFKEASNIYLA